MNVADVRMREEILRDWRATEARCIGLRSNYLGSKMLNGRLKYWIPAVVWTLLIFVGSGNGLSAEHTSRFLVPFLIWLMPDISVEKLLLVHVGIRKMGHLAEYAILAVLLAWAIFRGTDLRWTRSALFVGVWIACVFVASADEFRQTFAESRGPSPWDVMVDGAGAIFGLLIYSRWGRRSTRKDSA